MHTLVAFHSAVTDSVANQAVTAVPDQSQSISANGRFLFPVKNRVMAAVAMGDAITAARLNAPSLRTFLLPSVSPVIVAGVPPTQPGISWFGPNGPELQQTEEVAVEVSVGAQTVDTAFAGLWVTDRFKPAPAGPIFPARATATIVLTVGTWVLGTLTFEQTLPSGRYAVVGLDVHSADAVFARLVFPGVSQYRPGVVVTPTVGGFVSRDHFRFGNAGYFGDFPNTAQPQLEILGMAAGSEAITVFLDLIKIG